MRIARRTYSFGTNILLALGIVSAIRFDQTNHIFWLVLGGCVASVAISIYFIQHWKVKSSDELTVLPTSSPTWLIHDSLMKQALFYEAASELASIQRVPELKGHQQNIYWKTEDPGSSDLPYSSHDPAELAVQIVTRLQATEKRKIEGLIIARSGSITIKFKDDLEDPQTHDLQQLIAPQRYEPVN